MAGKTPGIGLCGVAVGWMDVNDKDAMDEIDTLELSAVTVLDCGPV